MFDPKSIMEKRELQEPIPTSDPADFPRSEEVPEGCIVFLHRIQQIFPGQRKCRKAVLCWKI